MSPSPSHSSLSVDLTCWKLQSTPSPPPATPSRRTDANTHCPAPTPHAIGNHPGHASQRLSVVRYPKTHYHFFRQSLTPSSIQRVHRRCSRPHASLHDYGPSHHQTRKVASFRPPWLQQHRLRRCRMAYHRARRDLFSRLGFYS
jgi:hypothetical protein